MMPVYNVEKYLDICLKSVMSQTCSDFEVILVNDGSTDKSKDICLKWKNEYPNIIKYYEKENTGLYQTRRYCLDKSCGDFLLFVDSDDYLYDSHAVEKIKDTISMSNADLLFFEAQKSNGNKMFEYSFENHQIFENHDLSILYDMFFNTKKFVHMWNKVFSRNLVDWEDDCTKYGRMLRDGPFQIMPILANCKKAIYLNEILYMYRTDNPNSLSHNFNPAFFESVITLYKHIYKYSEQLIYKSEKTDFLKRKSFMVDISICAIKARSIPCSTRKEKLQYLKKIGENQFFRTEYSLNGVEIFRKPTLFFLHNRMYMMTLWLSYIVGKLKGE
jgi:glycosyltransferase involved in cell wall biosynthesis